jgi:hypothetical protein
MEGSKKLLNNDEGIRESVRETTLLEVRPCPRLLADGGGGYEERRPKYKSKTTQTPCRLPAG